MIATKLRSQVVKARNFYDNGESSIKIINGVPVEESEKSTGCGSASIHPPANRTTKDAEIVFLSLQSL